MAFGIVYTHQFYDKGNRLHKIDIEKDGFGGGTTNILNSSGSNPITIKRRASKTDGDLIIVGSDLTFNFVVGVDDLVTYDALFESAYKDYRLSYYVDSSLRWRGWIKPENSSRGFIEKDIQYQYSLNATDAIADLKNIEFIDASTNAPYSDRKPIITQLTRGLGYTDVSLNYKVQMNTYESYLDSSANCTFNIITADSRRFIGDDNGRVVSYDSNKIVTELLKPFNATLMQSDGNYWIVNYQEPNSFVFDIDWDTSVHTARTSNDLRINLSDYNYSGLGSVEKIVPIDNVGVTFQDRNLGESDLTNGDFSTPSTSEWVADTSDGYTTFTTTARQSDYELQATIVPATLDPSTNDNLYIYHETLGITELNETDYIKVSFSVRCADLTMVVPPTVEDDLVPPSIVMFYCKMFKTNSPNNSGTEVFSEGVNYKEFVTGSDGYTRMTVEFPLAGHLGSSVDYYTSFQIQKFIDNVWSDYSSVDFRLDDIEIVVVHAESNDITFDRHFNITNTDDNWINTDNQIILFGDSNTNTDVGSFKNDASTLRSSQWNRYNKTDSLTIQELYAQNILESNGQYKNYIRVKIIDENDTILPHNALTIDSTNYKIIGYTETVSKGYKTINAELEEIVNSVKNVSNEITQLSSVDGQTSRTKQISSVSSHTHPISDIVNLQSSLDNKSDITHEHSSYDRATNVLSGANIFSDIVVSKGITTDVSIRVLTASDIGAASTLPELNDVVLTAETDLDIISYESSTGYYINRTAAALGLSEIGHTHSNYLTTSSTPIITGIWEFNAQPTFTRESGDSPFLVTSTVQVNNLNSNYLQGNTKANLDTDYEASLGTPSTSGYVLSSTTTGTRSWVNKNIPVSNLTDVVLTSVADLEIFSYDFTNDKWINRTATELGLSTSVYNYWTITDGYISENITDGTTIEFAGGIDIDTSYNATTNTLTFDYVGTDSNNYVTGASFGTGDGILTLTRSGLGDVTVDLDGRYAQGTFDNYQSWQLNVGVDQQNITSSYALEFAGGTGIDVSLGAGIVTISAASGTDEYVDSVAFAVGTGDLTLGRALGADLTANLDGRYITSLLDDTSPQLGGNLDLNTKYITTTGHGDPSRPVETLGTGNWYQVTGTHKFMSSTETERPTNSSYGHTFWIGTRDQGNGYGALWQEYSGGALWSASNTTGADPTWYLVPTLNSDAGTASRIPYFTDTEKFTTSSTFTYNPTSNGLNINVGDTVQYRNVLRINANNGTSARFLLQQRNATTTSALGLYMYDAANVNVFRVDGINGNTYIEGNLGIGINPATSKVHIKGLTNVLNLHDSGTSSSATGYIRWTLHNTTTDYKAEIRALRDGTSYGTELQFWTRPNTVGNTIAKRMTIDRDGMIIPSVGIQMDDNIELYFGTQTAEQSYIYSNATNTVWNLVSGDLYIQDNGTSDFLFKGDGTGTFHADGNIIGRSDSLTSDKRLKKNIHAISPDKALDIVLNLRGVDFEWKDRNDGVHSGYIAQEVEPHLPHLIYESEQLKDESGTLYKHVSYSQVIPYITQAMKAQQKKIDKQQSEIDELKEQVKLLINKIN